VTGLLDTSVVVALPGLTYPQVLPEEAVICSITLAELSVGPLVTDDPLERSRRQAVLQQTEHDFDPIPFDAACARAFGSVAASLRTRGRTRRARAFDALIAATALAHGLPLYTCNERDFAGIDGLQVRAVPAPQ
jgi:tRNA(fMet)-specific endonuclease VapC